MSFAEAMARKDDAVFQRFGEDATYISVFGVRVEAVRIIRKRPDDLLRFGDSQIITPNCQLRVRRAQIAEAAYGDRFFLFEDGQEIEYVLTSAPMLNARRTVWTIGAEVVDPSR